jgi:hypothetical protein
MFGAYWGSKIALGLSRTVCPCSADCPALHVRTVRLLADYHIDLVVIFLGCHLIIGILYILFSVASVVSRRSLQGDLCPNAVGQMIQTITLPQTLRLNHQLEAVFHWILKMLPTLI